MVIMMTEYAHSTLANISSSIVNNVQTKLSRDDNDRYYGRFLNESPNLESFFNANFIMESDNDKIMTFIIKNNLYDIFSEIPNKVFEVFHSIDLELSLEQKFRNEQWIVIKIFTEMDGKTASEKLDQLEDFFTEKFDDKFLDNVLLSVEFE